MFTALTPETIKPGMIVHPTDARTMLPVRHTSYTVKRFIHNELGQHCAVMTDGRHEVACIVTDALWIKS
jgi:hypothetical protein